jgi:hypothetical protein
MDKTLFYLHSRQFDPIIERHLRHKFDRRILALGIIMYLTAQIDRSNLGMPKSWVSRRPLFFDGPLN